jgi:formylglycine-generating enzyme required for sulfatase activity
MRTSIWMLGMVAVGRLAAGAESAVPTGGATPFPAGGAVENTLGMTFLPVPGLRVKFCRWETRVKEFAEYITATDRPWHKPPFPQSENHPAVNVSWEDAAGFCDWLTRKERQEEKIGPKQRYRLPRDEEWTVAAGFSAGQGRTPEARLKDSVVWPWGYHWPPVSGDGNYAPELKTDAFLFSAPAGSFRPNRLGLHDLGGNVWEWCDDWYNEATVTKTLRGGSFNDALPQDLLVAYRFSATMNLYSEDIGFRVVFDPGE